MENIYNFNKFEPLWENTLYSKDDVGYNGLLANPELLQNSFWINLLGFIGLKLFVPNSTSLNSYFGANKVRIDAIGHEGGDLFILTKAARDAKLLDDKTANDITRFLAFLKNKPDVALDEKLIKSLLSKIKLSPFDKLNSKLKDIINKAPSSLKEFLKPLSDIASSNKWAPEFTRILSDEIGKASEDDKILLGFLDKGEVERKKKEEEDKKKKEEEDKIKKAQSFLDNWDFSAGFSYFTNPGGKEKWNRRIALSKLIPMKTAKEINDYLRLIKLNKKSLKAFIFSDIDGAREGISSPTLKNEYGIDHPEGVPGIPTDQFYTEDNIKNIDVIFEGLPNKDKLRQYFRIKTFEAKFTSGEYSIYDDELWNQVLNIEYTELAVNSTSQWNSRHKKKQTIWDGDNYYGKTRGWAGFNSFAKSVKDKMSKNLSGDLKADPNKIKDLIEVLKKALSKASDDPKIIKDMIDQKVITLLGEVFASNTYVNTKPDKPFLYEYPELMEFLAKDHKDVLSKLFDNTFSYSWSGDEPEVTKMKDQLFKLGLLGKSGFTKWMTTKDTERDYPIGEESIDTLVSIASQGNYGNANFPYYKNLVASNGLIGFLDTIKDGFDKFIEKYKSSKLDYFSSFMNDSKWFPEGVGNKVFWEMLDKNYLFTETGSRDNGGILFYNYSGSRSDKDKAQDAFIAAKGKERESAKKYINSFLSNKQSVESLISNNDDTNITFMHKFGGNKAVSTFLTKIFKSMRDSQWKTDSYKYKQLFENLVKSSVELEFQIDDSFYSEFQNDFISIMSGRSSYYMDEFFNLTCDLIPSHKKFVFDDQAIITLIDSVINNRRHHRTQSFGYREIQTMYFLEKYNPPMGNDLKAKIDDFFAFNDPDRFREKLSNSYSSLFSSSGLEKVEDSWLKNLRDKFKTKWEETFDIKIKSEVLQEYSDICYDSLTQNIVLGNNKEIDDKERKRVLKLVIGKIETANKNNEVSQFTSRCDYLFKPEVYKFADKDELRILYNIGLRKYLKSVTSASDLDSDQPGNFLDGIEKALKEDAITQKEADEILWSEQSLSIKMKFSKLIKESTLVGPVMDQIAGEKTPIKPLISTHDTKGQESLKKALQFNNFEIKKLEGVKKMGNESIFEYKKRLMRNYDSTTKKDMFELKVKKIDETEEQKDKKMGFYFQWMTKDARHGGQGIKFLESFDVDMVPEGMEEWIKNNPDPKVIPAFHGTGSIGATMILRFGFKIVDHSLKKTGRMLGDGIYFSNVLDKSSQYIGDFGFTRSQGTVGYLLECEAYIGKDGVDHKSAGLGGDSIRSAEWCVFNPRVQMKIIKAHKVELVNRSVMEDSYKRHYPKGIQPGAVFETNDSSSGIIKEFSTYTMIEEKKEELKPDRKYWCNFTFLEGDIPDGKGNMLRPETWIKEFIDKKNPYIHVYPSQKGPNVNFNVTDINMQGNFIIPNITEFVRDDKNHMYSIFKDCLKATKIKK
jgi:hypothetical protein